MQAVQIEKIKQLVIASKILSDTERAEWLTLLYIMNDKQLSELDKIMMLAVDEERKSGATPAAKPASPVLGAAQTGQKPMRPGWQKDLTSKYGPGFSHIMNFSNAEGKPSPQQSQDKAPAKPSVKFADKLNAVVSEKELTTSRSEFPLELAAPGAAKPKTQVPPAPAKPLVPPKPVPPSPASLLAAQLGASAGGAGAAVKAPPAQQPKSPLPRVAVPPDPKFKPGLSLPNMPSGIKSSLPSMKPVSMTKAKEQAYKDVKLDNIEEVSKLTPADFRKYDTEMVKKKLMELMKSHGYHNVIFSMEKSPLYKSYIATGTRLLADQVDFEQLFTQPLEEEYLGREDFEHFADLLRQIQSA